MAKNKILRPARLIAAVAVAAALALTGCSSGSAGSGGSAGSSLLTPQKVPSAKSTLTVWSFMPGNFDNGKAAYDKVVAGFEKKYPQVDVKLVSVPYNSYFDQVRNATVARKGPDVITMYGGAQAYSYHNGLQPLQKAMEPDIEKNLEFVKDSYSQDGNLYSIPTGAYAYSLIVNQSLFEKAGIDPQQGLSDWSNLLDTCKTMASKGIQPMASAWKDGFMFETYMYMISSQMMDSPTLTKWINGKLPVDDKIFTAATNYVLQLEKAGCFGTKQNLGLGLNMYDDAFNQFYSGKAAMLASGSLSTAATATKTVPSTTVIRLPQVPESKYTQIADGGGDAGWSVTKWTKQPAAAVAFVNYMAGPEAQKILWDMVQEPPNLKNLQVSGSTPAQDAMLKIIQDPENHTGFMAFPLTVLSVYERNASSLIGGSMSSQTFTAQAQSAWAQTMKQ
ncbi:MAG: extracellular solute-binding protein [Microbacteriaceae bacterium]|nr:MAG: extracellular solute-binding protein [Microbacteriaceae bacterium]